MVVDKMEVVKYGETFLTTGVPQGTHILLQLFISILKYVYLLVVCLLGVECVLFRLYITNHKF